MLECNQALELLTEYEQLNIKSTYVIQADSFYHKFKFTVVPPYKITYTTENTLNLLNPRGVLL